MLFKKSEPRRWHPCLVITIGALTAIGAATIATMSKDAMCKIKDKIKSMWNKKEECGCGCTPEDC